MKSIYSSLTLLCLVVLFYGTACKKHNPSKPDKIELPAATQEGNNTFGCYLNGKPFIPLSTLFGLVHPLEVYFYIDSPPYTGGSLFIDGIDVSYRADTSGIEGLIAIHHMNIFDTGEYPLKYISDCSACNATFYHRQQIGNENYLCDSGKLHVTKLDTLHQIISGIFWFDAVDTVTGKKVYVRDGRFDLLYTK